MKKSENVYVILDWFDYDTNDLSHSADAFPIGVTTSLDHANQLPQNKFWGLVAKL